MDKRTGLRHQKKRNEANELKEAISVSNELIDLSYSIDRLRREAAKNDKEFTVDDIQGIVQNRISLYLRIVNDLWDKVF